MTLKKKKIGKVLLKQIGEHKWQMCWLAKPGSEEYLRRILPFTNYKDCEREAQKKNLELAAQRGFSTGLEHRNQTQVHAVKDAVLEAIRASTAGPLSRKNYLGCYNQFSVFLRACAPEVAYWHQIDQPLINRYLEYSRSRGLKYDTIRLRVAVVRLTSKYMARTYPDLYRDATQGLVLKRPLTGGAGLGDEDCVLSPTQLQALLHWLKANNRRVYMWSVLQGFCGLRLQEATYLRAQDFDPTNKTITITESVAHKPKTRNSYRRIAVCDAVVHALTEWICSIEKQKLHPDGFLFPAVKTKGRKARAESKNPAIQVGCLGVDSISHICIDTIKKARKQGVDLPPNYIQRKLRATFVQAMRSGRVDFQDLQTYIGHAPQSVLSRHYDHASQERLSEIGRMAQHLHDLTGPFKKDREKNQSTINTNNSIAA